MMRALRALYRGWMAFAHALGTVQTFLLLSVVYFVAIGITAPLMRLFSGDPLDRKMHDRDSIWIAKPKTNVSMDEARRLF